MFTLDAVAQRLRLADTDPERGDLAGPVAAVIAKVTAWTGVDVDDWPADVVEGALMLAARLHRRRNSPAGVEAFNEMGAIYVSRRDPDVAMLLGLGEWTPPRVG